MADVSLNTLFIILFFLLVCSAFFSGSETALMLLNRYKMRHLAQQGHRGAMMAEKLLKTPEKLISLILLGNNFVNILASSLTTMIALRLGGEALLAVATGLLTLVVLIFAEVTPKTLAAQNPEKIAYPAAYFYTFLLKPFSPFIWVINHITKIILALLGINNATNNNYSLNSEELRIIVSEANALRLKDKDFLTNILDLDQVSVEEVMIPRNEIEGIDLKDNLEEITQQIQTMLYTRIAIFDGGLDNLKGFVHIRPLMQALLHQKLSKVLLRSLCKDSYYILKGVNLHTQLINFQKQRRRVAVIGDEYGDIIGIVTLSDILEEIIGQFTSDPDHHISGIKKLEDNSYLVNAGVSLRDLIRNTEIQLSSPKARTLNGLILEYMEDIPQAGISLKINDYPIEIIQVQDNAVKTVKISPPYLVSKTIN